VPIILYLPKKKSCQNKKTKTFMPKGKLVETNLPEKYAVRLKWLQEKFKYRHDICANHHFKININCKEGLIKDSTSPLVVCKKKTEFMKGNARCTKEHRFSIVNLSISTDMKNKDAKHANAVIIDHYRKEYERFEPNGSLEEPSHEKRIRTCIQFE
jgi:hypothetical protein